MAPINIPKSVDYNGRVFHLQTSGRYYQDGNRWSTVERSLHRKIWIDNFGPIPDGFEVHHKDSDWTNNALDNLECLCGSEHASRHLKERWNDPKERELLLIHCAANREKTKAWHASPEGLKWHSENAKKSWLNRAMLDLKCIECGKPFQSVVAKTQCCSSPCWQRMNRRRSGEISRMCVICKKDFKCLKASSVQTCSASCKGFMSAKKRRENKCSTPTTPTASP